MLLVRHRGESRQAHLYLPGLPVPDPTASCKIGSSICMLQTGTEHGEAK